MPPDPPMTTSLPLPPFTVTAPCTSRTLTVPGRDGSLNGTVSRSPLDCPWLASLTLASARTRRNLHDFHDVIP